jgi:hypothetical protein
MRIKTGVVSAIAGSCCAATVYADAMTLVGNMSANQPGGTSAGEIVSFDPGTNRLFVTSSGGAVHRVNIFDAVNPATATAIGTVDFSGEFGGAVFSLTSVGADPLGRFGVATIVPAANTTTAGKVGFFNLATGAVIGTSDVGFHPDSVTFSADGSKLIVVNEGEFNATSAANAPGSISVIDVGAINAGNLATLPGLPVATKDFSAANLAAGVSLNGLRNNQVAGVGTTGTFNNTVPNFTHPTDADASAANVNAIEPEYATVSGNKVFVSLQEANAIAEFDLTSGTWTGITMLGTITQTVDANDTGSPTVNITQAIKGLPMPDTLATYVVGGKTYVVSANEGDARVDDRDVSRFGDVAGNDNMNPLVDTDAPSNFLNSTTNASNGVRADSQLGRLNVSRIDGDTDADGKIDDIHILGTRSMSIWERQSDGSLSRVADTGSFFEQYIRDNDAAGWADGRSDDKGPEPEGLTIGEIDGRTFAFVGMERTNGIFMFDITDPLATPVFVDYLRIDTGDVPLRPEGFDFVPAADSPTGQNLLIVGFEGDGTAASERVAFITVVPEPTSLALIGVGGIALLARRHRHQ